MRPKILIIEDEPAIRRFVKPALTGHGYDLIEAETAAQGLMEASQAQPDVLLLDLGLPDRDGVEVIEDLRTWSQMPIIVLSARDQEADKIAALDAGADDYLSKPFGVGELLARLRVALRHASRGESGEPVVACGRLRIDLARRLVFREDAEIHLTPIEWKLLAELAKHNGKVLTHRQLLRAVWGPGYEKESHYLRVHMGGLRRKIELDAARPQYLRTETGVGYRLSDEAG